MRAAAPALVIAAAFLLLAAWSWRKWPDILIDVGKEVYVPWRLSQGDVLYRDLEFSMGPLSPSFNALLFRAFGPSFSVLFSANLAILSGIVFLIYRLFARLGSRFTATVVCLVFLFVFAFSQYANVGNYNYVSPYRHEMTHGMALCLLVIELLVQYAEKARSWRLVAAGLCLGLIALTKVELFVPAAGASALAGVLLWLKHSPPALCLVRQIASFVLPMVFPAALSTFVLSRQMSLGAAAAGTFANWIYTARPELTTGNVFYQQLMGLDLPLFHLTRMMMSILWTAAAIVAVVIFDRLVPVPVRWRRTTLSAVGIATFYAVWFPIPTMAVLSVALPLPLLCVVSAIASCRAAFVERGSDERFRPALLLSLWSIAAVLLLLKMGLRPQLEHYGFVLSMPAAMLAVYCAVCRLPRFLQASSGRGDLCRALMLGLTAACALKYFQIANTFYRQKVVPFGSGGDLIYHDPTFGGRHTAVPEVLRLLRKRMPPGATLMAMPEGAIFNYLLRARSTTRHYLLSPWEIAAAGGEDRVLLDLASHPPDFVVVLQMSMEEHGYDYFGEPKYGAQIMRWVNANYETIDVIRGMSRGGAVELQSLVFKRRDSLPPGRAKALPN